MIARTTLSTLAFATGVFAAQDSRTYGIGYTWSSPLVEARLDPIISPGAPLSAHVHTITGGSAFAATMADDTAFNSKCTQFRVLGDKSNYWTPTLYHENSDGSFTKVEMDYMKAYYFFEPTDDEIVPFPQGYRYASGDPFNRQPVSLPFTGNIDPAKGAIQATSFTCPRADGSAVYNSSVSPNNSGEGPMFPDVFCDGLYSPLRYNVHFPSCIDPSKPHTDYQDNTVWASSEGASSSDKTNCPPGWLHVPHLFLEFYWNTMDFTDWPQGQGKQPFRLANGDPTGYGLHADFISGWDLGVLQHLISTCNAGAHGDGLDSCPGVNAYAGTPTSCTMEAPAPTEVVNGTLAQLPGCNPVQPGPARAAICDCSSGKPVCNGAAPPSNPSGPPSTPSGSPSSPSGLPSSPSSGPSASSSAAAGAGGPLPTPTPASSSVPSGGSSPTESGIPSPTETSDPDNECSADDEDDYEEEEPKLEMLRRHARHLDFHKY